MDLFDSKISIHAPVKGATPVRLYHWHNTARYFNPRTREGCDVKTYGTVPAAIDISIHAPVKGATAFKLAQSLSALSSIILRTD